MCQQGTWPGGLSLSFAGTAWQSHHSVLRRSPDLLHPVSIIPTVLEIPAFGGSPQREAELFHTLDGIGDPTEKLRPVCGAVVTAGWRAAALRCIRNNVTK